MVRFRFLHDPGGVRCLLGESIYVSSPEGILPSIDCDLRVGQSDLRYVGNLNRSSY
jgi:hypothetical protein